MAVAKKKKKTRTRKKTPTAEETWQSLTEEVGLDNIQPYNMQASFVANSALDHPKFGVGIVIASHQNKIDVVFKDGARSLVQSRS